MTVATCEATTAPTAATTTSPRLRGEVDSRAQRGCRVRGMLQAPALGVARSRAAPHPYPLPASGAREHRAALIDRCAPRHIRRFTQRGTGQIATAGHG